MTFLFCEPYSRSVRGFYVPVRFLLFSLFRFSLSAFSSLLTDYTPLLSFWRMCLGVSLSSTAQR